jgi:ADP-ribosyl-[dinitrogen reductase] hydrolase
MRPRLYLNRVASFDWLIALEFGRVDDGQASENWEAVNEAFGYLRDEPGGRCLGFKVLGFSIFDAEAAELEEIWDGPRFDVPVLGLQDVNAGEIVFAARSLFGSESSVSRQFFSAAVDAKGEEALALWLACLQAGDSMAHFGLGYTLYELGRFPEAYRHLRHYTEIAPCGSWNWCWLGKAATAIGERVEAQAAYERAIELEAGGEQETDAPELLAGLDETTTPHRTPLDESRIEDRIRGCLLGGAIGDALGAPIEFLDGVEIGRRFGDRGVRGYLEAGGGRITDDTQMTLFTAEGLIRARVRYALKGICHEASVVDHAYARWLQTQGFVSSRWQGRPYDGWLIGQRELWELRAPGNTCLTALRSPHAGTLDEPINDSKGCGALMRAAPIGLIPYWPAESRFGVGAEIGALTHGHPSGYLASGFLATVIGALITGSGLPDAIHEARGQLTTFDGHEELLRAVDAATNLAIKHGMPTRVQIEEFGGGWVAEETLGIALWIALAADDPVDALSTAVSHGGDSDSTGAVVGNLLGASLGVGGLPVDLIDGLVERPVVGILADDLVAILATPGPDITEDLVDRYPGW